MDNQFYKPNNKVQGSPRMAKMTNHSVNTGQSNKPESNGKSMGRDATNSGGGEIRKMPHGEGTVPLEGH